MLLDLLAFVLLSVDRSQESREPRHGCSAPFKLSNHAFADVLAFCQGECARPYVRVWWSARKTRALTRRLPPSSQRYDEGKHSPQRDEKL